MSTSLWTSCAFGMNGAGSGSDPQTIHRQHTLHHGLPTEGKERKFLYSKRNPFCTHRNRGA